MIKLEIPVGNKEALAAFGRALLELSGNAVVAAAAPVVTTDTPEKIEQPDGGPAAGADDGGFAGTEAGLNAGGVELDGEGIPWDARLHVASKTKRQSDQTWTLKRQLDAAFVTQIKAELLAAQAAPPATGPTTTTTAPDTTVKTGGDNPVGMPLQTKTQPANTGGDAVTTFAALMSHITAHQADGTLSIEETLQVCQKHGITAMPLLNTRPDLIPAIYADYVAIWAPRAQQ